MKNKIIAVIGLGYVGLPLAIEFGKKYKTIGFDLSKEKISNYKKFYDPMSEVSLIDFECAMRPGGLEVTSEPRSLINADFLIIAVPTPVGKANIPDFEPLIAASISVGQHLKVGATVIYESTVYPGATEEICIPILEKESGLVWKRDFHVGYSPERVNPGDKEHTITNIVKIVSGDDASTLKSVGDLYGSIVTAGVYFASSIKVAEAAKVIENTQRDLNIALMNELAIVFDKLGVDTLEVLNAAGTKWNFLPFRPGLVGGHCIGVDPYYLTYKSEMLGYHPQIITAGRRINDGMASYIAEMTIRKIINQNGFIKGETVTILGLTFKENCPDLRNSKVVDLVNYLTAYGINVFVHDPIANCDEALKEYGLKITKWDELPKSAVAVVAAVAHSEYLQNPSNIMGLLKPNGVLIDIKSSFDPILFKNAGHEVWRL